MKRNKRIIRKKKVVQWDLSKMLLETKSQKTSKSKIINREKKLSSQIISTKQTSEIHDFLPKIKSEPQQKKHLTIRSFAEDQFFVFTQTVLSKLDSLTKELGSSHRDMQNLQQSFDDFKRLKCRCKRRADRYQNNQFS